MHLLYATVKVVGSQTMQPQGDGLLAAGVNATHLHENYVPLPASGTRREKRVRNIPATNGIIYSID